MPKKSKSIIGKKFNKLTVVSVSHIVNKNYTYYNCVCECGGKKIAARGNITSGSVGTCGCGKSWAKTHGMAKTVVYRTWAGMLARCYGKAHQQSPKNKCYAGITVCKEWHKFENFYRDMGDKPKKLTLDRIDSTKGYSAKNCRWATYSEQRLNQVRMYKK